MNHSPNLEKYYHQPLSEYNNQFKKSPNRMILYQLNRSEDHHHLNHPSQANNNTSYQLKTPKTSTNIKKISQSYSTLRQTFNTYTYYSKIDKNQKFTKNLNQHQNLRKTVNFPQKIIQTPNQLSYSAVAKNYKQKKTQKINQWNHQFIPNSCKSIDYQKINQKLKDNAKMLSEIKKLKSQSRKIQQQLQKTLQTSQISIIKQKYMKHSSKKSQDIQKKPIKKIQYSQKKVKKYDIIDEEQNPYINGFLLIKKLGEGKFGAVYLSIHRATGSIYAIKKVRKEMIRKHFMVQQFIQQVKIQSYLNHRNIVKLYGFFEDNQFIYLILQYMEQGTLFNLLKKSQTLSQLEAASKLRDVCFAIKYIHQNSVAHRDIKPQNIVMTYNVCKLCDFGWAALCDERRKTYCGTFDYAAPQILEGAQYDMSVDLWCLGVLAYQLMVGKAPFYHISRKQTMKNILHVNNKPIKYPENISKKAVSFIQNLVKKNPQQRMQNEDIINHPFLKQINEDLNI